MTMRYLFRRVILFAGLNICKGITKFPATYYSEYTAYRAYLLGSRLHAP